jgi:predicted nucleic acid-binding protein
MTSEPRRTVFADTFYWISLASPGDFAHKAATAFDASSTRPMVVTTEEVLTEFLTFFGGKGPFLRRKAVAITVAILSDPRVRVLPQSHHTFRAGFELYSNRLDKGYSLTDCISMHTVRRESIAEVLTDDHHFEQEGFRAIFGNL